MTASRRSLSQTCILLLFLPFGCSRAADAKLEKQAAAVLLHRYETVVSARSKLLSRLSPYNQDKDFGAQFLGLPFIYMRGGLNAIGPKTIGVVEGASDTVLTGAKDFVGPSGLGMVMARTSSIAILVPGAGPKVAAEFKKAKVALLDGRPVWTWSVPPSEGHKGDTTFYAAIVASSFFLLTHDSEEFREVANSLEKGTEQADLPGGRDWRSLRSHAYWGYRAVRRSEGAEPMGLQGLSKSIVGLEMFSKVDDGKLFFNVLVPDDQSGSASAGLPSPELLRFRRAAPGVWQAVIAFNEPEAKAKFTLFGVVSYFGYVVML